MPPRLADFFSPREVTRVASLQLIARQAVEGLTAGRHRSPHHGASVEFKEHRPYVPGDELRNIDWKAFGKSNRLYIRQFEEETNLRCTLLVDQSGSMAYGGKRAIALAENDATKKQHAIGLAASLAYLLLSSQDAVGVMTFDTRLRDVLPPRTVASHLRSVLHLLVKKRSGGETDLGTVLKQAASKLPRRGLVVLISDGLGDPESLGRSLSLLRAQRQDVIFLQLLDPDEVNFPFNERIEFLDLENESKREIIDSRQIRKRYLESFERHQGMLAAVCRRNRVDHAVLTTDRPLTDQLARFVAMRQAGPVRADMDALLRGRQP